MDGERMVCERRDPHRPQVSLETVAVLSLHHEELVNVAEEQGTTTVL